MLVQCMCLNSLSFVLTVSLITFQVLRLKRLRLDMEHRDIATSYFVGTLLLLLLPHLFYMIIKLMDYVMTISVVLI